MASVPCASVSCTGLLCTKGRTSLVGTSALPHLRITPRAFDGLVRGRPVIAHYFCMHAFISWIPQLGILGLLSKSMLFTVIRFYSETILFQLRLCWTFYLNLKILSVNLILVASTRECALCCLSIQYLDTWLRE